MFLTIVKHWSNEEETIKLIDTIIVPYIVKKISQLNLPKSQKALVIWDVFKGQITEKILHKLKSLDCEFVAVPPKGLFTLDTECASMRIKAH